MEANFSPIIEQVSGGVASTIYYSAPIQFLIANPLISHIVVLVLGVFPISFPIIHRTFNKWTGFWATQRQKEGAVRLPVDTGMGKPESYSVPAPQPESISSKAKTEAPVPEKEAEPEA